MVKFVFLILRRDLEMRNRILKCNQNVKNEGNKKMTIKFLSFWSIVRRGEKRVNFVEFWPTTRKRSGSRGEDAVGGRR